MAWCSRAWLTLFLLACCALVQSSYGSRLSPREPKNPGVLSPPMIHGAVETEPRRRDDGATEVRPSTVKGTTGHHGADADGGGESSEQRKGSRPPVLQQALGRMLGSKLARRILGGEAEDSAAGPSCHSNNAHITCAPPAQH
uniref:Uncharacterized protein n=1 Tax=Aegilops tauschii subsp. strangulata TaxID=200361 RepID=A0A453H7L3_AEGTS|nr:uncharacterized protein LOC109780001 [Aegilops tauschii subsp. strangulata]